MPESKTGKWYELVGPIAAPVVVLVHGIGLNRHIWREYVPVLAERYRVLSYDLYGHGESPRPSEKLSLGLFAGQLRELLDEVGIDRCAIAGFSIGGMINRRFAMDHSERTSALVVLNSPHERSPQAQKLVEERVARTARGGPAATVETSLERWFTAGFRAAQTSVVEEVRGWILAADPVTYTQSRQVLATGVTELIRPQPPITQPALIMTCENDSGSTPAMSHAIASEISGAQTVVVPELQHLGLIEQPALFSVAIQAFLDGVLEPG